MNEKDKEVFLKATRLVKSGKLPEKALGIMKETLKKSSYFGCFLPNQVDWIERTYETLLGPKPEPPAFQEPECPRCENVGLLEVHTEGVVVWGRCSCPIGVGKNWPLPIIRPDQFITKPIDPAPWIPQDKNINPGSFINDKIEGWRERVNISKAFWRENLF